MAALGEGEDGDGVVIVWVARRFGTGYIQYQMARDRDRGMGFFEFSEGRLLPLFASTVAARVPVTRVWVSFLV
jgi:hypothetical protein